MDVSKKRILKVDLVRGIAIILVICGHDVGLFIKKGLFDVNAAQVVYDIIYTFHMPLFFMMSGYIEYANHRADGEKSKLATVLKKDIISLYIPYIFLNYIYWFERFSACKLLGVNLDNPVRTSITELAELLYNGDGVSWFLLSILHIKLLFDIFDRYVPDFVIFSIFSVLFWLRFLDLGITIEAFGWGVFYYTGYLVGKYNIDKIGGGKGRLYRFYVLM